MWRADAHDTLPLPRRGAARVPPVRRPSVPSPSGDAEALARTDPLLRYLVPRGAEEEFCVLFGMRARGLDEEWGRLSGWTLSRRLWAVAEACAGGVRPYASEAGRGSTGVALFALAAGASPGPEVPHRASRPLFALVAPVLAAAGLAPPPLPLWVTMVALSGIPAWDIPRMEAHLAYRMAARMRAGPVRAPLGDMGWE